jgi:hypothetical protein
MLQRKKTQIPAVSASFRQAISFTQAGGEGDEIRDLNNDGDNDRG